MSATISAPAPTTVSTSPPESAVPAPWHVLSETFSDFRAEFEGFEHLIENLLEEMDQLRTELDHRTADLEKEHGRVTEREQALAQQRQALAEQREEIARLSQHFAQQEAQLSATLGELTDLQSQLAHERELAAQNPATGAGPSDERLERVEQERDALRSQLDETRAELVRWAGSTVDQADVQQQLADARQQLAEARAELLAARKAASAAETRAGASESAAGNESFERSEEWDKERTALEAELELVRTRAADLYETVNEQKRELAQQRSEMTEVVKQLRKAVDGQAAPRREVPQAPQAPPAPPQEPAAAPKSTGGGAKAPKVDPVVTSVMAQFAKLQNDIALRRGRK